MSFEDECCLSGGENLRFSFFKSGKDSFKYIFVFERPKRLDLTKRERVGVVGGLGV